MNGPSFFTSDIFRYFIIPLLIFLARIADVSIGTIRIISISRGIRVLAAILGFFEVLIWLLAITQIMHNLTNVVNYIAYAAGFGMGNFVGISIEKKLAMGSFTIRVITKENATDLINFLSSKRYSVTSVDAQGSKGAVKIIYVIVKRREIEKVRRMIEKFNPKAFYTIEDIRFVAERRRPPLFAPHITFFRRFSGFLQKRK